jgi:hypothetical protein
MGRRTKTAIVVRTQFEGLHHWPEAPDEVAFLRSPHRHVFHVQLELHVEHDDRELEFILVRRALDKYLATFTEVSVAGVATRGSCEDIAKLVVDWASEKYGSWRALECTVTEDGENGARVSTVDP